MSTGIGTASTVGFIGIGNMGLAMALRLRDRGWPVRVRDVDPARVAAAVVAGAQAAGSAAELARGCSCVIVAVVDAAQADEVLFGVQGAAAAMRRGSCVMLCPTIAPASTEGIAARLTALGIDCIDAPMSGGPVRACDGSMSLMVAADESVFERHRALIEALSANVFRVGTRLGNGARTKLVNNLLAAVNLAGAAEALALAARLGLDATATQAVIERSSGQSWIGTDRMRRALVDDLAPRAHTTLLQKDSALAIAMADAAGFDAVVGRHAAAVFTAACKAGHGGLDDACLLPFLRGDLGAIEPAVGSAIRPAIEPVIERSIERPIEPAIDRAIQPTSPVDSAAFTLDEPTAARYAECALESLAHRYPYALQQLVQGDDDLATPHARHPLFHGSYDWHSSVHMQWSLARLLQVHAGIATRPAIVAFFGGRYSAAAASAELAHLQRNPNFERPYGWGWLMQLHAELQAASTMHAPAADWARSLEPIVDLLRQRWIAHLALAPHPQRTGLHGNSAFAMVLALAAAEQRGDAQFADALKAAARRWFGDDTRYPARYEPSASDFLSGGLCAAVLMQRALPSPAAFDNWWHRYVPAEAEINHWLKPAPVASRTDAQLVHADGLNLSRAWCFGLLAEHLPAERERFERARMDHMKASLAHVTGGDFVATHWLVSFALLALGGLGGAAARPQSIKPAAS